MSFFKNPFKSKKPISSYDSEHGTTTPPITLKPVEDLSQYNRGTKYGNYKDAMDFIKKLNKVARSTYQGQKDEPEKDPELIRIMNEMNITSSTDFYEKIQKMLDDTMKKWEKCKLRCSSFFCDSSKFPDTIICEQRNNQLSMKPIAAASKDCQVGVATSVDFKKGQVYSNIEEEMFLECANITPNFSLIADLLYVYLLDAHSENPIYKQDDPEIDSTFALDSILGLFKDLPNIFKDPDLSRYFRKLQRKIDAKLGGKRKRKTRKNKSKKNKSRKNKSRKNKSKKNKYRK